MKKYAKIFLSILIAVCLFTSVVCAESSTSDDTSTPESITFRGIEWYTPYSEASKMLQDMGDIEDSSVYEKSMLDNWNAKGPGFDGDPYFYGGGVQVYSTASVAGYNADLKLTYIYPIIDGHVSWDVQSSEFFKAEYEIESLGDMEAAYVDLKDKLSHLYGEGEETSYYDDYYKAIVYEGMNWYGADGSVVRITIRHKVVEDSWAIIDLIYCAPNSAERIIGLEEQNELDKAAEEAKKREENAGNYDGL